MAAGSPSPGETDRMGETTSGTLMPSWARTPTSPGWGTVCGTPRAGLNEPKIFVTRDGYPASTSAPTRHELLSAARAKPAFLCNVC